MGYRDSFWGCGVPPPNYFKNADLPTLTENLEGNPGLVYILNLAFFREIVWEGGSKGLLYSLVKKEFHFSGPGANIY